MQYSYFKVMLSKVAPDMKIVFCRKAEKIYVSISFVETDFIFSH